MSKFNVEVKVETTYTFTTEAESQTEANTVISEEIMINEIEDVLVDYGASVDAFPKVTIDGEQILGD